MLAALGYLIADLGVRLLPAPLADRLARLLARAWFAARPRARRTLERNLARVVPGAAPERRRAAAAAAFEHFAVTITDFLRLGRLDPQALDRAVEVRGAHHLAAARAAGRGVIVLSAHLGNWEWGAAFLAANGPRLHLLARPHPSRWVDAFFARRRRARHVRVLAGRPRWRRAAAALRRSEWLAVMGDRGEPGGSLCSWAQALARRTDAIVLPAMIVRVSRGRYAACFEPPLLGGEVSGGYRAALRSFVERYPGQWCAFEPLPEGLA